MKKETSKKETLKKETIKTEEMEKESMETEDVNDSEFDEDDFYYEGYNPYYKPNKNYPIDVTGDELKNMSEKVCTYLLDLVANGKKDFDIKKNNTARALLVCVKETLYSILEDNAKKLDDKKPDYKEDKTFEVGAVIRIPPEEGYPKKDGVIVGVHKKKGERIYDLFLGHTTLTNLSENAVLDLAGLIDYSAYCPVCDNEEPIVTNSKFKVGDGIVFKITEKHRNPFDVKHLESDDKRGIITHVGLKNDIPVYSVETDDGWVYGGVEESELIEMIKSYLN